MQLSKELHLEECYVLYKDTNNITSTAKTVCENNNILYTDSERRKVSKWINEKIEKKIKKESKILIYDIETSRLKAHVWWTGKQYISHSQLIDETKIITISFKWLGSETVDYITWDNSKKCDKKLIKEFLKYYNEADFVIGVNNDNFDNRLINSRALKHGFDSNTHVRSLDIQKEAKRLFRLPSYSMSYIAKFLGLDGKYNHPGISMWEDIQYGTKEKSEKALKEMITYNIQDVITTEEVYMVFRKYMINVAHIGVLHGSQKYCCSTCGSSNVKLYKTTVTPSGTIQHIMQCQKDDIKFKINNTTYLKYLNDRDGK